MPGKDYKWERFWYPRGSNPSLSDAGYLYDPDLKYGHILSENVSSMETIEHFPCLVLLGEPGMGKSHAMQAAQEAAAYGVGGEDTFSLSIDLRSYGDESRLVRDLFESPTWASWLDSESRLIMFLDSLDECLLNMRTVASLLKDEFKKYPVERLSLRIACRTADWPAVLEDGLREAWGEDEVGVFELAPLRRADVIKAARAKGIDAIAFADEVLRRDATPLAAKPVTLGMLLNAYKRDGRFPATQAGLYQDGCRLLCEEVSRSRMASGHMGTLTAEQRMAVAARIAAVTVLTNRSAIWTKPDEGDLVEGDVLLRDLSGNEESVGEEQFSVNESTLKETLSTGLFSSRGPDRIGWAHQTYAEFLAALYLTRREVSVPKILTLLTHPGDPDGKLVPQLHESAAWLAGMVPDVFRAILKTEPEILLKSDVASATEQDRAALVEALLAQCDRGELVDDWGGRQAYERLDHAGLASQIRPYIADRFKGLIVRRVAMEMAEFCRLESLLDDLIDVALDPTESADVRSYAAAAAGIGSAAVAKLKPLATGEAGDDPIDQLKGEGLRAVWPTHMTADELFATLTAPKRESYFGAYHNFVSHELARSLEPKDLPVALRWVETQQRRYALPQAFRDLMDGVMFEAWQHLESSGVTEAFTKAALSRLRQHDRVVADEDVFGRGTDPTFESSLHAENGKRRRVIAEALNVLHGPEEALRLLAYSGSPLVLSKDVPWMLGRLRSSSSTDERLVLAHLVEAAFDRRDTDQFSTVAEAVEWSPELKGVMARHTEAVPISSPEAQGMRARHYELEERREQREERPRLDPSPTERVVKLLDEFETGKLDSWWLLNLDMTLEPYDTHYDSSREQNPDLTSLPVWQTADAQIRTRILEAAEKYVHQHEPEMGRWLNTDGYFRPVASGYKAIRLLARERTEVVEGLSTATWRKWAPAVFTYPAYDEPDEDDFHSALLERAYRQAPEVIVQTVLDEIDRDDGKKGYLSALRRIGGLWDARLTRALTEKAEDKRLRPSSTRELLTALMERGVDRAREFAESLVTSPVPRAGEARTRAVTAAEVLVGYTDDAGWRSVWPKLRRAPKFGREVVSALVAHHEHRSLWHKLKEEQLAELFVWISGHYPQAGDPQIEGYHTIGHREQIARWRDSILGHLSGRGTRRACDAIRQIARELPELDGLKWTLRRAEDVTRRLTWTPPRPRALLIMCREHEKRLVQNGDQLLDVLFASLWRLQTELQEETYAAIDLWDRVSRKKYKPVDENRLSDYVKRHLQRDLEGRGVVVNREVEIRGGRGGGPGELTDIHVDALARGPSGEEYDTVSAIIEVKGCWHPELKTAMETQLVGRYLKDNPCRHGLYLVGWFLCDQWVGSDYRKGQTPKLNLEQARRQLDAQASGLSSAGAAVRSAVIDARLR